MEWREGLDQGGTGWLAYTYMHVHSREQGKNHMIMRVSLLNVRDVMVNGELGSWMRRGGACWCRIVGEAGDACSGRVHVLSSES
jgi:hypothetical protein